MEDAGGHVCECVFPHVLPGPQSYKTCRPSSGGEEKNKSKCQRQMAAEKATCTVYCQTNDKEAGEGGGRAGMRERLCE